ncbi:hypothetical protein P8610_16750 [Fictibacillus sp. UD]|uniref:hypothetical protein n=1 Tax=Fictibacillus sp. UD TaxID=3038777 RepID=UPI00374619B1
MDTFILYYKIYNKTVVSKDYISWAFHMLENNHSSYSINVLSSLSEAVNIFEVEDYFRRAAKEIQLQQPSYQVCSIHYLQHLATQILLDETHAIDLAYEIYEVMRELDDTPNYKTWYEISELIDDYRYGDNPTNLTMPALIISIQRASKQLLQYKEEA